jgi:RNA polymerase sigma-70 factor, ECF subfamily
MMAGGEPAQISRPSESERAAERRLVESAQSDPARFADVYEKYFELVYAYVVRRTRDRARAEDLTSEIFHKALANLPRFKWTGAPFAAWLLRIASNLIADRGKQEARQASTSIDESESTSISRPIKETQQAALEDCERRARLYRLVDGLANDQRRVVVMRFAEEKSIREIASDMGRSEGAVKQLQFRALQALRAKLSDE